MTYTTGIRSGEADGVAVSLRCDDMLARTWKMRMFRTRGESALPFTFRRTEDDGAMTYHDAVEIFIPSAAVEALAEAFGDPDHRYQAKCRDLEAELQRANSIIVALTNAVAGQHSVVA